MFWSGRSLGSSMADMASSLKAWRGEIRPEPIAAHIGISRATLHNWEKGQGAPSLEQIERLEEFKPGLLALLGLSQLQAPTPTGTER